MEIQKLSFACQGGTFCYFLFIQKCCIYYIVYTLVSTINLYLI